MTPKTPGTPGKAQPPDAADPGLLAAVSQIWEESRTHVARTVNTARVKANWLIGRQIVEAQQAGKRRAGYGEDLAIILSRWRFGKVIWSLCCRWTR